MNRFFIEMIVGCAKCNREEKVRAQLATSTDVAAHLGSLSATIHLPITSVPGYVVVLSMPRPKSWRDVMSDGQTVWWCEVCVSE